METIAAIATPPGRGAIAIVRCSGPLARPIAARVFRCGEPLVDRVATYGAIVDVDGVVIDRGLALVMDAPRTATGEDVVELHVHGSPVAARETLRALVHAGARIAAPGEFTRRAYLNGKMDLSAAEAVGDLIDAETRAAARAASANLAGGLRREVDAVRERLNAALEELEGSIDYPEEIAEPDRGAFVQAIDACERRLQRLVADWERGRLVREGLAVAIVGPPNAGKSSLLNALLGEERVIVSPIPGTTRDTVEERIAIDGNLVRLVDTAGLRTSEDPLERAGIARSRSALDAATLALVVLDGSQVIDEDAQQAVALTRGRPRVVFFNKRDVGTVGYAMREAAEDLALCGSAFDPGSVEAVKSAIAAAAGTGEFPADDRPHLASARQSDAVARGLESLRAARVPLERGEPLDLAAGDLLRAAAALGEITGSDASEAILDGIFARFCVGK